MTVALNAIAETEWSWFWGGNDHILGRLLLAFALLGFCAAYATIRWITER